MRHTPSPATVRRRRQARDAVTTITAYYLPAREACFRRCTTVAAALPNAKRMAPKQAKITATTAAARILLGPDRRSAVECTGQRYPS